MSQEVLILSVVLNEEPSKHTSYSRPKRVAAYKIEQAATGPALVVHRCVYAQLLSAIQGADASRIWIPYRGHIRPERLSEERHDRHHTECCYIFWVALHTMNEISVRRS